jgi:hypothetical protein
VPLPERSSPTVSGSFFIVEPDFPDVDSNPIKKRPANLNRERPKPSLHQKRKLHRIGGFRKNDEETITREIDFFALAELGQDVAQQSVMTLDHGHPLAVTSAWSSRRCP